MAKFAEMESSINTIAKGTTIKGGITAVGDFRLDGTLEGNITLNGKLVVVRAVNGDEDLMVVTNAGIIIRTPLSEVKIAGRNTQGVKIINLEERQKVASISIVPHEEPSEVNPEDVAEEEEVEETPVEEVVNPNDVM